MKLNIALFGALSDEKFKSKVEPLIDLNEINKVLLYRFSGNPIDDVYSKKIIYKKSFGKKYFYYLYVLLSTMKQAIFYKLEYLVALYFFPFGVIFGIIGILTRTPFILILPGSDLKKLKQSKFFHFILRKSFKIGARGENSLNELYHLGIPKHKIFILHNSFKLPIKNVAAQRVEKKWDIVFIGYFRKPKRLDVSVEVVQKLKIEFPNIKAVFVGYGDEFQNIQKLIDEKDLHNNILLTGHKSKIEPYLEQSKIFLMTSESEGLPMVLIESMSFGVPVVTSDINDISDVVIDSQNGFLIKSLITEDYVKGVQMLLNDENKYNSFSKSAIDFISEFYDQHSSFDQIKERWFEIIRQE